SLRTRKCCMLHKLCCQLGPRRTLPNEQGLARTEDRRVIQAARVDGDQPRLRLRGAKQQTAALGAKIADRRLAATAFCTRLLHWPREGERRHGNAQYRTASAPRCTLAVTTMADSGKPYWTRRLVLDCTA